MTARRAPKYTLVLRTCRENMTSPSDAANGFRWPTRGPVACKDWKATKECGNGLHGLAWGVGDGSLLLWDGKAKWLVVRVLTSETVEIGGKVKFPRGSVVFCGERTKAVAYLVKHGARSHGPVVADTPTAGDEGVLLLRWWDVDASVYRIEVAKVGKDGIKPRVKYKLDADHRFVAAEGSGK